MRRARGFRWAFAWLGAAVGAGACAVSCRNVDPGPNFVVPDEVYDADYFFCHVEPELLFAKKCGSGDPGDNNSCHFNSSAVSGMAMTDHPPVRCANDHPVDRSQIGAGSPAQGNLQSTQLVMSRDYQTAPLYLRPTGQNHPRKIFEPNDPVVEIIRIWATK